MYAKWVWPGGSSPRARGKRAGGQLAGHQHRFIPACAGKTKEGLMKPSSFTVHPRVRGENGRQHHHLHHQAGSSPRARGKRPRAAAGCRTRRFIPACAGKTHRQQLALDRSSGSSPRARGKPLLRHGGPGGARFIPACAGKTRGTSPPTGARAVHPRVRGENAVGGQVLAAGLGSSPRARGKLGLSPFSRTPLRFIPACAGKTWGSCRRGTRWPVHPRVRGENCFSHVFLGRNSGSSPRARGKRRLRPPPQGRGRFIPACAGKTRGPSRPVPGPRFIPACAGKTAS